MNDDAARSGGVGTRLTVIIVNYESWAETLRLTASLRSETAFGSELCQMIVVDNGSRGPIPAAFAPPPAGVTLLARPDNGGFAVGVNAGWRASRSPWLLVLNPDVDVRPGFLGQVLAKIDQIESLPEQPPGLVGFGLRNSDGSPQGSVGAFPSLARTVVEQFIPRSRRKYQSGYRIRSGSVDWVTGACMLVNAAMISALGGMDEDFFLYYEEVAFCLNAIRRGWRVEFDASLSVIHRHPLQNRAISPRMRVITRHSKLLYFRKHLPRWQFLGLSAIVEFESVVRGTWCRVRGDQQDARAWRLIRQNSSRLRRGEFLGGREILALADSVAAPNPAPAGNLAGSNPENPDGGQPSAMMRTRSHPRAGATSAR